MKVHVYRNPGQDHIAKPWLVACDFCAGSDYGLSWLSFGAKLKPLAWAASQELAMPWAHNHALEHEARRCHACLHVPTGPLPRRSLR